ncbi:MAG: N-acetylmuramoyl-L-alanine amidase [Thermoanaerobacteraceae bacterium]|nr:N-acetylmuramoyl-L-alanine amidase [Thermoanaerobacteraceae bacterium]
MYRVYISPSNQENNVGYGNYGTEEMRMHEIGRSVIEKLKGMGYEVYENRPQMSLNDVCTESNSLNVDAHVAIHSNATAEKVGKARGCEAWYREGSEKGKRLAEAIYSRLRDLTPVNDRGIKPSTKLYELNHTTAPAVIIEVGFHNNPEDAQWIINNKEAIADEIAMGISDYFGIGGIPIYYGNDIVAYGVMLDNTTYAPLRELLEKLGYIVKWDATKKVIDIYKTPV